MGWWRNRQKLEQKARWGKRQASFLLSFALLPWIALFTNGRSVATSLQQNVWYHFSNSVCSLHVSVSLTDKNRQGFRGLTPILQEVPLWVKCYQTALRASRGNRSWRKIQSMQQLHCGYSKKVLQPSAFSNHHPEQSTAINTETKPSMNKDYRSLHSDHD